MMNVKPSSGRGRPKLTLATCLPSLAELSDSERSPVMPETKLPSPHHTKLPSENPVEVLCAPVITNTVVESANATAKTYTKSYTAGRTSGLFNFSLGSDDAKQKEASNEMSASQWALTRDSTLASPLGNLIFDLKVHDLLSDLLKLNVKLRAITWRFEVLKDLKVRDIMKLYEESRKAYREASEIIDLDQFNEETQYGIRVDVDRTMQKDDFFKKSSGKDMIIRIVLTFLQKHTELGYSQGMTELIAICITALQNDKMNLHKFGINVNKMGLPEDVVLMIEDSRAIEADTYEIFVRLMRYLTFLYSSEGEAILNEHWNLVHHVWLKTFDPVVYLNLSASGIEPQLYLLRWYRLFFAREFKLEKLYKVWDFLLDESHTGTDPIHLMDCLALAMILHMRDQILKASEDANDPIKVFQAISEFPDVDEDVVHDILSLAQTFKERKMPTEAKEIDMHDFSEEKSIVRRETVMLTMNTKSGYLYKEGGGTTFLFGRKSVKRRWFVLQGDKLSYFSDEKSLNPLKNKQIRLRGRFQVRLTDTAKFGLELYPLQPSDGSTSSDSEQKKRDEKLRKRTFYLFAADHDDMMDWFEWLQKGCAAYTPGNSPHSVDEKNPVQEKKNFEPDLSIIAESVPDSLPTHFALPSMEPASNQRRSNPALPSGVFNDPPPDPSALDSLESGEHALPSQKSNGKSDTDSVILDSGGQETPPKRKKTEVVPII
jgi:hypothetical protein